MIPDIAATPAERTEAARQLFAQAGSTDFAELVTLYAMELCVLGGPRHAVFDEEVTSAWLQLRERQREKAITVTTEGLVRRRLLTEDPRPADARRAPVTYSLSPALGIALAARCRPAFVVITQTADPDRRTPKFFALGDQHQPVRGIVVEEPAALPASAGDFPHVKKLGPLGWFYRYVLVSPGRAPDLLAGWAIAPPPPRPAAGGESARSVSLYRHSGDHAPPGVRLLIRGDGTKAQLLTPGGDRGGSVVAEHDLAGLREVMADLLAGQP